MYINIYIYIFMNMYINIHLCKYIIYIFIFIHIVLMIMIIVFLNDCTMIYIIIHQQQFAKSIHPQELISSLWSLRALGAGATAPSLRSLRRDPRLRGLRGLGLRHLAMLGKVLAESQEAGPGKRLRQYTSHKDVFFCRGWFIIGFIYI